MRIAVALIVSVCLSGAAARAQEKPNEAPRARAVEIYGKYCQLCHGPEGKGSAIMKDLNFVKRTWKHGRTQAEVIHTISEGVPGTPMQPFKDKFTPEEIAALASLVRSYDKPVAPRKKKDERQRAFSIPGEFHLMTW